MNGRAFHVIAKPTGSTCNLSCRYCYFLEKSRLYPGTRSVMNEEVLRSFLDQYIRSQPGEDVTISWQGGEPTLMGIEFFQRSLEIAADCNPAGKRLNHTIQTNGTLLDEGWCDFFRRKGFLVGLSLDGPPLMHDAYRLDPSGRPTSERVLKAARLLEKSGVDFNILCSVHAANSPSPLEVYRFLRDDVGAEWIQFIPIVERINEDGTTLLQQGESVTDRSVRPGDWGDFLLGVYAEWLRHDVGRIHVNIFESAFASWAGARALMCVFSETCGDALALEFNGDLYSCDHFVEPEYLLGNIIHEPIRELALSERQSRFGNAKRDALPGYCRECPVLFACAGGCPKNRFMTTTGGEPGLNYLCEGYRKFFEQVDGSMRIMAELHRRGRNPAEITGILAEADSRLAASFSSTRRNDPCPCGSGKKYKYCHGK